MTGGVVWSDKEAVKVGQCIPYFSHCGKIPNKANMKDEFMPWSGGLVSNGKGGAAGGNITASAVRKQREMIQLPSSSLASPETQAPGATFKVCLPCEVKPFQKHPGRHIRGCFHGG